MHVLEYLIEHNRYLNLVGIAVVLLVAYLCSRNRAHVNFRVIAHALVLQLCTAFVVLKTSCGKNVVSAIADCVGKLYEFADAGSSFVFGNLANIEGPWGFVFAVKVLPIIIFFGAFMSLLFHLGIVQRLVGVVNFVVQPLLGTSGAETLCAISNSFLGQTEAPLLIRNYLRDMTKSEMLVVMVSGMGTISGAILVVFAAMGVPAEHLLSASVMAIPGTIMIAKILYPETAKPKTSGRAEVSFEKNTSNALEAIAVGTSDGLQLALNVGAMLVSFLALIALFNAVLGSCSTGINTVLAYFGSSYTFEPLSLNAIFAYIFSPFAYLLGFVGDEALKVGQLLGTKVSINELVAYSQMMTMNLSERTANIVTYALCGFSNFSCIGIQIGGIGALVPEKRKWLSELGLLAVLGSSLSNILSAMIAGLLL